MKEQVLEYLKVKFESSTGSQGCYIPSILIHFSLGYLELKPILNDLHKEKKIYTKKGISGILIYYNK